MRSPIKGESCSAIRRRFNALDYFVALHLEVRDQEVEDSNPFAPLSYGLTAKLLARFLPIEQLLTVAPPCSEARVERRPFRTYSGHLPAISTSCIGAWFCCTH
jgi:hypothetical protein